MINFVNNAFYTWEEVVQIYPDKWVVMENVNSDEAGFIGSGELIAVGDFDEVNDFVAECYDSGRKIESQRTTDVGGVGVLYVKGIEFYIE